MGAYIKNKIISISLPILGIILFSIFILPEQKAWQWLLMVTFTLGYTHYFIGGYYQIASFSKQPQPKKRTQAYCFLVLIAAAIITVAQYWSLMWLVAFVTIPYFLLHGFFNEISLVRNIKGLFINPKFLAALSLYVAGLTMTAFSHYSAHFNYDLSFMSEAVYTFGHTGGLYLLFKVTGGVFVFLAGVVCLYEVIIHRNFTARPVGLGLVFSGAILLYVLFYPFNYVYAFTFLLTYHFLTWMIHYGVRFKQTNQHKFYRYLLAHIVIVCLVAVVYAGFTYFNIQNPSAFIFNGNVFLFLTTIHITTAFLNDDWCKRLFGLI